MKVIFYYHSRTTFFDTAPGQQVGSHHLFCRSGNWFLVTDTHPGTRAAQITDEQAWDLYEASKNEENVTVEL